MSVQQVEAFYEHALTNPAVVQFLQGMPDAATFEHTAAELGNAAGFAFSAEDARQWVQAKLDKEASGELSDAELESVAGGKGATASYGARNPIAFDASLTTVAPLYGRGRG